jgi:hypothetical protein
MTDLAVIERTLIVMAVAMAVQSLLLVGGAIGAWIAYRRATSALEHEVRELRARTDEVAAAVHRAAAAVARGTDAVSGAVDEARHAAGSVGAWVGSLATVVSTPRAAAAVGVLRGVQWWRRRRTRTLGAGRADTRGSASFSVSNQP